MLKFFTFSVFFSLLSPLFSQIIFDDFEATPSPVNWQPDNCNLITHYDNPFVDGVNPSSKVLLYHDVGGQYANIRFTHPYGFDMDVQQIFSFKIYVPSDALTGNQNNQVSLKLQNAILGQPWTTQSEIIKNIQLDTWQTVTFDFMNDNYLNYNPNSGAPVNRKDFNRVVIQVNGENNFDQVLAYIDDFQYDGSEILSFDQLVWNDEFDQNGAVNPDKWFHQTLIPNGNSWFNNEVQHYTNRIQNSFVNDGKLSIVAIKEPFTNQGITKQYTSARLNSKFAFTYGKVEVRAKMPIGVGTWPAIWTLGKNISESGAYWHTQGFGTTGWPACGEIDIMEHWGSNQNFVQSATHTPSSFGATVNHGGQIVETVSTEFHTYTLYWYPNKLVFLVDDKMHYVYQPAVQNAATWPFFQDQYLLLNIAIEPTIDPNFTQGAMEVDYVRVYQPLVDEDTSSLGEFDGLHPIFEVFPNPGADVIYLHIDEAMQCARINIFNLQGLIVQSVEVQESITTLNIEGLDRGVYVIQESKSGMVRRFVKG